MSFEGVYGVFENVLADVWECGKNIILVCLSVSRCCFARCSSNFHAEIQVVVIPSMLCPQFAYANSTTNYVE